MRSVLTENHYFWELAWGVVQQKDSWFAIYYHASLLVIYEAKRGIAIQIWSALKQRLGSFQYA